MTKSAPADDLLEWVIAQYRKAAVGPRGDDLEGGRRYKALLARFPAPSPDDGEFGATGFMRMLLFQELKMYYPLSAAGYTCLAMGARAKLGQSKVTHFAYAYWRSAGKGGDPEYICISPTFDSRDGEYRSRFLRYSSFRKAYTELTSDMAAYEEATLRLVGAGELTLSFSVYPAAAADKIDGGAPPPSPQRAALADLSRLLAEVFAVALALDLWQAAHRLLMLHTNPVYVALMGRIGELEPALVKASAGISGKATFALFQRTTDYFSSLKAGQKLVPVFLREAMQPGDLNLAAWRELALTQLASDLVLNFVTPSFALYNQWTYVEGADETLFENPAMEERYQRGRAAGEAIRGVREARRRLDGGRDYAPSYASQELSAQLYESIEYAQSFLLMSSVALLHSLEDVGWALQSLPAFVQRAAEQLPAAVGAVATPDAAGRLLFEYAYGAHCLHSRGGAAHTDIHPGNLTFYMWSLDTADYADPVVTFVTGPRGEADTYVFPASGASGCLIDFSRCLLGPGFRARLEQGRPAHYATLFYQDQANRVMRALNRYAPGFVKNNQERLKAAVFANFQAVFPVLCAVDFIAIGRTFAAALGGPDVVDPAPLREFRVDPSALVMAKKLETAALELFMEGLQELVSAPLPGMDEAEKGVRPFPGVVLLPALFDYWRFPVWAAREPGRARTCQPIDLYNHNNPLEYTGSDYARFPPWARLDEIERHIGKHKMTDLFEPGARPFLDALRPRTRIATIAEHILAEQEALDGEPVATMSSWLGP